MSQGDDPFIADFHAGDYATMDQVYKEHFDGVSGAVGRVLKGADRDTVVHNVFYRLVSDARLRANFRGGSMGAWLKTVARNEAIDFRRRYAREELVSEESAADEVGSGEDEIDAKLSIERFRRERLPEKLTGVFEARFLRQLSQREAADSLGMQRTTLVYQEQQIRDALRAFFLEEP